MFKEKRTNAPRQPKINSFIKGRGLSIGAIISLTEKKLKSILVTKGKTKRSLEKYEHYLYDKKCHVTYSDSGYFTYRHFTV